MSRRGAVVALAIAVLAASMFTRWLWRDEESRAMPQASPGVVATSDAAARRQLRPDPTAESRSSNRTDNVVSAKAQALPPPGTALELIQSELADRARRGDATAASRLFRDTRACLYARQTMRRLAATKLELEARDEAFLDGMQWQLDQLGQLQPICAGVEAEIDDGRIYSISLHAAELGDDVAACFYLNAPFLVDDGRLATTFSDYHDSRVVREPPHLDADIVAAYLANAPRIAQAGIERGDWNVVLWAAQAYESGGGMFRFTSNPLDPDPEQAYRFWLLWRLGETDPEVIRGLAEAPIDTRGLSADQVAAAQRWAGDVLRAHFSPRPALGTAIPMCGIPPLAGLN